MRKYYVLSVVLLVLFTGGVLGQNQKALLRKVNAAEKKVRAKIPASSEVKTNVADRLLGNRGAKTARNPNPATVSAIVLSTDAPQATVPEPVVQPPGLAVRFTGDWPPTGFCDFNLPPKGNVAQGAPAGCNDRVSGVKVPFNLEAKICEHDGQGSAGWGKCRNWGVGDHFVGHDLNDRATTFWVKDADANYVYFTSADDEVPPALTGGISYKGDTDGNGSVSIDLDYNTEWYTKTYTLTLPPYCRNPQVWESTRNNNAEWSHTLQGGVLRIVLKVKPRAPFGANSWVGVGIRCRP